MIKNLRQIRQVVQQQEDNRDFFDFLDALNNDTNVQTDSGMVSGMDIPEEKESNIDMEVVQMKRTNIRDVSRPWKFLFEDKEMNYSILYNPSTQGLFICVLLATMPQLFLVSEKEQRRKVDEIRLQMIAELDGSYEIFGYRQYGYVKSEMQQVLWQIHERYHVSIGHYLSDFLKVNLLVIDSQSSPSDESDENCVQASFEWLSPFQLCRSSVICHRDGYSLWGCFIASDSRSHLNVDLQSLSQTCFAKDPVEPQKSIYSEADKVQLKKILKKTLVKDLQKRAYTMEIPLTYETGDGATRNKRREDLERDIFQAITASAF